MAADDPARRVLTWPVNTFEALAASLGPAAFVTVRGKSVPVAEAHDLVPAYYFPVTSAADLASKLADLELELGDQDFERWAERNAAREDNGGWS